MSHKVICPRGRIWDPSLLAGLPPTETPCCPICGDPTPSASRTRLTAAKLIHWSRSNPQRAGSAAVLLLLGVALAVTTYGWWQASRSSREEAQQTRLPVQREEELRRLLEQEATAKGETLRLARQAERDAAMWKHKHEEIKGELAEAKRQRNDAIQKRNELAGARKTAEDVAQAAEQLRQDAVYQRHEAARQLVRMHVAAGTQRMENGELPASLLWFAEALRLAQKEKLPEQTHRLRLAAVLAQCPRPVQVWVREKRLNIVQLSADGRRVLTAGVDGAAEVWDTTTGRRIGDPFSDTRAPVLYSRNNNSRSRWPAHATVSEASKTACICSEVRWGPFPKSGAVGGLNCYADGGIAACHERTSPALPP